MTSCYQVIVVPHLLVEGTKLDEPVAHHVRIGRIAGLHLLHGVASHLVPVFLMTVYHLQLATILGSYGSSHLEVFLRRAVPLFLFLGSNLDIEAVGMQAQTGELPNHYGAVYSSRKQNGNTLALQTLYIQHDENVLCYLKVC